MKKHSGKYGIMAAIILAFSLSGCGKDNMMETTVTSASTEVMSQSSETDQSETESKAKEPLADGGGANNPEHQDDTKSVIYNEITETTEDSADTTEENASEENTSEEIQEEAFPVAKDMCLAYPGIIGLSVSNYYMLHQDGSFEYYREVHGQAANEEGYAEIWCSAGKGTLGEFQKESDLCYSLVVQSFRSEPACEFIQDGTKVTVEAPDIKKGDRIYLYQPGFPVSKLPEGFMNSADFFSFTDEGQAKIIVRDSLPGYALYVPDSGNDMMRGRAYEEMSGRPETTYADKKLPPEGVTEIGAADLPIKDKEGFSCQWSTGNWNAGLDIYSDGSFQAEYYADDQWDSSDEYYMTVKCSTIKGKFTNIRKLDEYTYEMEVESAELTEEPGKIRIENEVRYISSDDSFLWKKGDKCYLYLKGKDSSAITPNASDWSWQIESDGDGKIKYPMLFNERSNYLFIDW